MTDTRVVILTAVAAASADEAMAAMRTASDNGDPFQIALLDYLMPDTDGETLGRGIKADSQLCDTALVMLTSTGHRGDAARMHRVGFIAYLIKPVKRSQLLECLQTIMGKKDAIGNMTTENIITRRSLYENRKRRSRILLVEDNIMNQKLAVHLLNTKLGYCVDAVANGKEAIESLSRQDYDLVLMDCQMPVMDGHEATVAIRRPDSSVLNHDIPIIAMTAGAMKGDKEKCLASGMDDYVTKPIRLQNLVDAIERNLPADDDASEQRQDDEAPQEKQPTESRCTKAPYDRSLAFDHMEGDADMFREFAELFITHGPKMLAKVQECVSRGDPEAVAKAASAFEDLLDILAADTALLAAQAVKTLAQSGDLASLQESAADLAVEIRRLETALQRDTAAAEACD